MIFFYTFIALCALCACTPDAEQIEKQIEQHQTQVIVDPNNVEIHYQLGHAHLALGRYKQGASHLKDAVRLSKKHALAHRDLG
jgi:cytochrome c-type biogenesis protein CcmH/NrfG